MPEGLIIVAERNTLAVLRWNRHAHDRCLAWTSPEGKCLALLRL